MTSARLPDRASVAEALNLVEDRRPEARAKVVALLSALRKEGALASARRIGITGPPGVGKSTLVSALTKELRKRGRTVGIVAVDPSSLRSGGALLGDRTRIAPDPSDLGVFVRSVATAGELGGLARSVPLALLVLSASFDDAVIETVGVGQTEADVRNVTDTVVFVVQPGSGDALQFLKAGIMEVPDIIVVNKSDQAETARRARADVRAAVASLRAARAMDGEVPILETSALLGTGIADLADAIDRQHDALRSTGALERRRAVGAVAWGVAAFARRYGELGIERAGGQDALRAEVAAGVERGEEIPEIVEAVGARVRRA